MQPTVSLRLSLRPLLPWAMACFAALSLGCAGRTSPPQEEVPLPQLVDTALEPTTFEAEALDMDAIRDRRLERLQQLRDGEVLPPPPTVREGFADSDALRSARALRHRGADGNYEGFRLSAVRMGGLANRLGFQDDDVVWSVNGRSVTSILEATDAANAAADADRLEVVFRRGDAIETLTLELDGPLPPPTATVRELLQDPTRLATLGRLLLHRGSDGAYDGYRLSAVRRNSPVDLLGFKSGDVVHQVAGVPVTGLVSANDAYVAAQAADRFDVLLTRRGQRFLLTVEADAVVPLDQVGERNLSLSTVLQRVRAQERALEESKADGPPTRDLDELAQKREERLARLRRLRAERKEAGTAP